MAEFPPTAQQQDCIEKFRTGKSLKIEALAGAGKTSTLVLLAQAAQHRRGTAIVFNKANAQDLKGRMPRNVQAMTMHGLAFRNTPSRYTAEKKTGHFNTGAVINHWKSGSSADQRKARDHALSPQVILTGRGYAYLVSETVKRWFRSSAPEIVARHVPRDGAIRHLPDDLADDFVKSVVADARGVWAHQQDHRHPLPLSHDGYRKLWALSDPQIEGDFLFIDEAQDLAGVQIGIIEAQRDCQIVLVGDEFQQLYAWAGALDAMSKVKTEEVGHLTKSWRFGPAIAENASVYLRMMGATMPLVGNDAIPSEIGPIPGEVDAILSRTNSGVLENALTMLENDQIPYVQGGVGDMISVVHAAWKLMGGKPTDHPEFLGFANWTEVREAAGKPEGKELERWVKTLDRYECDCRYLLDVLGKLDRIQPREADAVLSTGHRSKGLEWEKCRLSGDFLMGVKTTKEAEAGGKDVDDLTSVIDPETHDKSAELKLLYVAATRAKRRLEIHPDLIDKVGRMQGLGMIA